MVSVDEAVPPVTATGFTLNEVESPGYETAGVRLTLQQKPFRLVIVIVVPDEEPS